MKLYFSPLACSMATRIVAYETGLALEFLEVDPPSKTLVDGSDYLAIHPLGLVPALQLDDGSLLTENAAILAYLADLRPEAGLAPPPAAGVARARLHQWLSFVGTELHKAVYIPLLDRTASDSIRQQAVARAQSRLGHVAAHLATSATLLDRFSAADAYLFTVLNWTQVTPIDLARWPALVAYQARLRERPSVARALADEVPMYTRERARHAASPPTTTRALMAHYNRCFQDHDAAALDELVGDDCVIENTHPAPDGERRTGKADCVALWRSIALDPAIHFDLEGTEVEGDRAVIAWRMRRGADAVRGVNLMRVRAGRIVEARGYVKGA